MTLGGKNLDLELEVETLSNGHQTIELTELCILVAKTRAYEVYIESYGQNTIMHMSIKNLNFQEISPSVKEI